MQTLFNPLIGGLLIGLAATLYLLTSGRVLGISGILTQTLFTKRRWIPRLFLLGLIIGGGTYGVFIHQTVACPEPRHPLLLIVSGLLGKV